ncbi:MAG: GT4 family glycosyltransferase PelF [Firmicutes bacterium]|nr:GT4 family glycosyltransferase PelF [Bacillota bacterium]
MVDKIKLVQVIGGGEVGGAEEHVLALLTRLNRKYFEPYLICLCRGPFAALAREKGVPTTEIIMQHKLDLTTVPRIRSFIKENQLDLVHTHGVRANLVARLAARLEGRPVVTTVHSALRYDYTSRLEATIAGFISRLTTPLADRIIAVSEAVRADLVASGARNERIITIYNGLDFSRFSDARPADIVRRELGLAPDQLIVALIGRLHPVKGHVYFFQAAAEVLKQLPDVRFLAVGDGPLREELKQLVCDLGIAEQVIFTGYYSDIKNILGTIDILCLPSLMEGLPLVVLEAMYFGKPAVASRVGGIPEVVADGQTGLLVPPQDAAALARGLLRLLSDADLRRRLGEAGQALAQQFSIDNMVKRTEELYTQVLRGGADRA